MNAAEDTLKFVRIIKGEHVGKMGRVLSVIGDVARIYGTDGLTILVSVTDLEALSKR